MNATNDWFDVTQYADSITILEDTEMVQVFVVEGDDRAVVVDAGRGIGDLRGMVEELTDLSHDLVLTHWHWDHIGSASQFDRVRIHPTETTPDGRVTIDAVTDEFADSPGTFIEGWQDAEKALPGGFDPDTFDVEPVSADRVSPLSPGDTVDLGDRTLEVLHIPGHTPGQIALLDRDAGVLIGADVIHREQGLKLHFETGDVAAAQGTFAHLTALWEAGAFDTLLTCHNPPIAGDDLDLLRRYRDGLAEVLSDDRAYEDVDTGRTEARQYRIAGNEVLTKPDVRATPDR
jgi:glyoxylase-like metal-dependent hydrolase (beta-lactamase superfamily II)